MNQGHNKYFILREPHPPDRDIPNMAQIPNIGEHKKWGITPTRGSLVIDLAPFQSPRKVKISKEKASILPEIAQNTSLMSTEDMLNMYGGKPAESMNISQKIKIMHRLASTPNMPVMMPNRQESMNMNINPSSPLVRRLRPGMLKRTTFQQRNIIEGKGVGGQAKNRKMCNRSNFTTEYLDPKKIRILTKRKSKAELMVDQMNSILNTPEKNPNTKFFENLPIKLSIPKKKLSRRANSSIIGHSNLENKRYSTMVLDEIGSVRDINKNLQAEYVGRIIGKNANRLRQGKAITRNIYRNGNSNSSSMLKQDLTRIKDSMHMK